MSDPRANRLNLDSFKAGQQVRCTVTAEPRTDDARDTIARLMRHDAAAKRGLRTTQRQRAQNMIVYNRGNRDWTDRKKCSRIVRVEVGQGWTMAYYHQIAPDLRSVGEYISIASA